MSTGPQYELPHPPNDAISAVRFAPTTARLLVSSWDRNLYLYDTTDAPNAQFLNKFEHRAPILDACWGEEEDVAYTGGLDWDVRRVDLNTGEQTVLSSHDAGIKSICYSPEHKILVSASWDCTLHIHHVSENKTPATVPLPAKPFALAISKSKLVVAMAGRQMYIHDLAALGMLSSQSQEPPPNTIEIEPFQKRESSLKFMTRALACMPNDAGYASSSIEGRVAMEWFDASDESQARKYAFKCHRQAADDDSGADLVYPVHALAFHPNFGSFVSGGGDGGVAVWDVVAKRRIRAYPRYHSSVAAMDFSADGTMLAVGVSPGFEDGSEKSIEQGGEVKVYVRVLAAGEAKYEAKAKAK